jgi:hypothetical protein
MGDPLEKSEVDIPFTMFKVLKGLVGTKTDEVWNRQLWPRGAHTISLVIIALAGLLGYTRVVTEAIWVLIMCGVILYELVKRLDQGLPLMQVAALLAVIQWLVGPWLTYNVDLFYGTYFMRVPSADYFSYALPATAAFVIGLLAVGVSVRQRGLMRGVDRSQFIRLGFICAVLGFASGLGERAMSGGGFAFMFHLLSQFRYVGAVYFILSPHRARWIFAAIAVFPALKGTAESAMFHDLLLWLGILICYAYGSKSRKILLTIGLVLLGLASAFTIQGIKKSYRDKIWNSEQGSLVVEVKQFWSRPDVMFSEETLSNAIVRINQGWIVAAIMQNIPSSEPYAMGDTIGDALVAGFLPRLIWEDKAKAGGQVTFRRFTGLPIDDRTSMGISLLGESYANVGPVRGILVMLAFGGFMSLVYGLCLRFAVRYPTFYFWIPVIFCQTIKAETDLVTVLNHITKGSIVVFGMYWLLCIQLLPAARSRKESWRKFLQRPVSRFGKQRLAGKLRAES